MNTQEKIQAMLRKSKVILEAGKLATHPYICEITGLEVDRPCSECVIYKGLDSNCRWRTNR